MHVIPIGNHRLDLHRRAARGRRLAKLSHDRTIAEMLDGLANYLELEAIIEEAQIDPFLRVGALPPASIRAGVGAR
jgi:hypothetical protein